jgi:hypothetical protein
VEAGAKGGLHLCGGAGEGDAVAAIGDGAEGESLLLEPVLDGGDIGVCCAESSAELSRGKPLVIERRGGVLISVWRSACCSAERLKTRVTPCTGVDGASAPESMRVARRARREPVRVVRTELSIEVVIRAWGRDWSVCADAALKATRAAEAQMTERSRCRDDVLMRFVIGLEGPGWWRWARPLLMTGGCEVTPGSLVSISDRRLFGGVRLHGSIRFREKWTELGFETD